MSIKYLRFINDNFWTIVSTSSALVLIGFLAHGAYQGYHSEDSTKYREARQEMQNTKNLDDGSTVKRYIDKMSGSTVREFTAHDGQLLCVATTARGTTSGDTITCVKIEQPQSCKASY